MARKKVMFEINDEEDTKVFDVQNDESEKQPSISDDELFLNLSNPQTNDDNKVEEFNVETVNEDIEISSEVIDEKPEFEVESDTSLNFEPENSEQETKIFDKVEGEDDLSSAEENLEEKSQEANGNMTKRKVKRQPRKIRRKKQEKLGFNWFFWISLIIIAIPVGYFISLLIEASKVSHVPILGDRIKNTIVYTINESDVEYISSSVKQLEGVENAEINLIVETLRITVDVKDDYTEKQIEELILSIYTIIDEKIPIATYFTRDGDFKQYDLDIMAYNDINSEELIIVNLIKNGSMEEYSIQVLSRPVNPELVEKLLEEQKPVEEETEQPQPEGETEDNAE